ncbi:heavy metal-associated isoprenylated plant protein 12-like [Diospyros lotus]|uniref:heavy metal-associated isoprenylated plant protein 12-like n=1 Tax=Diospyros lotus TaxID=55363 RepID=UPI002258483B|nr:heavy metal-associated isoprenylated plant protein 12-like [Diospyros lotus]
MKKMVVQLETSNEKIQKKAMTKVSGLPGLEEIDLNVKEGKLTVKGVVDPVEVMDKLKKICHAHIVSLGPEKEEKKKEEDPKKKVDPNEDDYVASFIKTYGYHPATFYYPPPPAYGGSWY